MSKKKCRVALLIGNKIWNWNTITTFKRSSLNLVGVCVYDNNFLGFPIKYIFKSIIKKGIFTTIDQILGRLLYKIINLKSDKKRLLEIFDIEECKNIKNSLDIPIHFTNSYNNNRTLDWISKLDPDIIVVHSNGWVGKSIRNTPKVELIIGGHPGLSQFYRGAYPAFWAIYNREQEKIGYSIFQIDSGVDTGDLIFQKKINISENDSYMSIDWKGMKEIAKKQVEIIEEYEETEKIVRTKHSEISDKNEYPIPGMSHYIRYLYCQKNVK